MTHSMLGLDLGCRGIFGHRMCGAVAMLVLCFLGGVHCVCLRL